MLGILALLLVKDHQKTKDQLKSFDERIINCTYAIQEHMLGIAVFFANNAPTLPTKRERSGSVVECLTRDRRAAGSSLTGVTALCP